MPQRPIAALALALTLLACSEPVAPERTKSLEPLLGQGRVRSIICGGFNPGCLEVHASTLVEFTADSMIASANDSTIMAHEFRLIKAAQTIYGTYPSIEVWLEDSNAWRPMFTVFHLSADSLELGDNLFDGYTIYLGRN